MTGIDDLYIVNYCHPNCTPLKNIMRLPEDKAFSIAYEMAGKNADTTAFYRFADFENYYPRRMEADKLLYNAFISLGGRPKTRHPLSFVLQGSAYLDRWFGGGIATEILLNGIPSEFISFTYGDSMAVLRDHDGIPLATKEMLLESILGFEGTIGDYMKDIEEKYHYIEAQLWNDDCCADSIDKAVY